MKYKRPGGRQVSENHPFGIARMIIVYLRSQVLGNMRIWDQGACSTHTSHLEPMEQSNDHCWPTSTSELDHMSNEVCQYTFVWKMGSFDSFISYFSSGQSIHQVSAWSVATCTTSFRTAKRWEREHTTLPYEPLFAERHERVKLGLEERLRELETPPGYIDT